MIERHCDYLDEFDLTTKYKQAVCLKLDSKLINPWFYRANGNEHVTKLDIFDLFDELASKKIRFDIALTNVDAIGTKLLTVNNLGDLKLKMEQALIEVDENEDLIIILDEKFI